MNGHSYRISDYLQLSRLPVWMSSGKGPHPPLDSNLLALICRGRVVSKSNVNYFENKS
jgi:hypothetical protein